MRCRGSKVKRELPFFDVLSGYHIRIPGTRRGPPCCMMSDAAALAAGGTDAGVAGLRPKYHPDYYGAYARDPDGNKLCCACHRPG